MLAFKAGERKCHCDAGCSCSFSAYIVVWRLVRCDGVRRTTNLAFHCSCAIVVGHRRRQRQILACAWQDAVRWALMQQKTPLSINVRNLSVWASYSKRLRDEVANFKYQERCRHSVWTLDFSKNDVRVKEVGRDAMDTQDKAGPGLLVADTVSQAANNCDDVRRLASARPQAHF